MLKSLAFALALGAAGTFAPPALAEPLKVVASFSILGDIARQVGGDDVAVETLVGPDGDAHVFEPTPADARKLGQADILVLNGLHFEGWMPRLVETSGFKGETIVATQEVVPLVDGDEDHDAHDAHAHGDHDHAAEADGHDHGPENPHAWQDIRNGVLYAKTIAAGFEKADPEHAKAYAARARAYAEKLEALDARTRERFAQLPQDSRSIVTSHDAFGYFGRAYGVNFIAPAGMSTEAEASARSVAAIIDQIRDEKIRAVFVENITNPRLIEQITRETGAKVGGELYSDALSGPDGPAATYYDMMRYDADTILSALQGS